MNKICKVWWQGICYSKPQNVKNVFFLHFKGIYNKRQSNIFSLGTLLNSQISVKESEELERKFTISEVEAALHSLGSDKAPRPGGFNNLFIKNFWPYIKDKVMECFHIFEQAYVLPKGFNSSFIALVPKVLSPLAVQDYRPISLLNNMSKLLTKVLATRMEKLSDKLFEGNQYGFIKGRQTAESILIVNEVAHLLKTQKESGIILKLDFEKAFDSVNCVL